MRNESRRLLKRLYYEGKLTLSKEEFKQLKDSASELIERNLAKRINTKNKEITEMSITIKGDNKAALEIENEKWLDKKSIFPVVLASLLSIAISALAAIFFQTPTGQQFIYSVTPESFSILQLVEPPQNKDAENYIIKINYDDILKKNYFTIADHSVANINFFITDLNKDTSIIKDLNFEKLKQGDFNFNKSITIDSNSVIDGISDFNYQQISFNMYPRNIGDFNFCLRNKGTADSGKVEVKIEGKNVNSKAGRTIPNIIANKPAECIELTLKEEDFFTEEKVELIVDCQNCKQRVQTVPITICVCFDMNNCCQID